MWLRILLSETPKLDVSTEPNAATVVSVETPNLGVSSNKREAHFNARKKDELTYRKSFTCQVIVKLLIILLNQAVMDFGRGFGTHTKSQQSKHLLLYYANMQFKTT